MLTIECPRCSHTFRIELIEADKKIAELEAEVLRLRGIISRHRYSSIDFDTLFQRFGGNK